MELHTSGFSSYCLNTSITKLNSLIGTAYFKYLTSCYKRYDEHISKVRAVWTLVSLHCFTFQYDLVILVLVILRVGRLVASSGWKSSCTFSSSVGWPFGNHTIVEQCKCTSIENIQTKINNSQYSFEYINIGNHNLHLFVSVKVKVVIKVATNNCLHLCQNVHNLLSLLWRESGWKIEIWKIEKWSERKKLLDSWQKTLTCAYHSRPISSFSCFPKTVFNFSKENLLQRGISIPVPEARE